MRILMLHNHYKVRGGEDESTAAEVDVLRQGGHEVELIEADNAEIEGRPAEWRAAASALWNADWKRRIEHRLMAGDIDIMHVQNFFPLFSPSVYYAAASANVPVIQAVRNYRLVCPSANLFRDGGTCTDCVGKRLKWPGVLHGCYANSRPRTATVAAMTQLHWALGTWRDHVSRYVAVSSYVAEALISDGFPPAKIEVKPNFVALRSRQVEVPADRRRHVLFVGRLVPEKGLDVLLAAWKQVTTTLPLLVVGPGTAGPSPQPSVEYLGPRTLEETYELMRFAACVVVPGRWPEPFGRVAVEAFANGAPVIASDSGGIAEIVRPGENGQLFASGDAGDLAAKLNEFLGSMPDRQRLSARASASYRALYTPAENLLQLEKIYGRAIGTARQSSFDEPRATVGGWN